MKRLQDRGINEKIELLLSNLSNNSSNPKIALPTPDGLEFESLNDILFFEASGNYTYVHLRNNTKYIVSKTLGDV